MVGIKPTGTWGGMLPGLIRYCNDSKIIVNWGKGRFSLACKRSVFL